MFFIMALANANSDELVDYMRICLKGKRSKEPVYISFLPFIDDDTKNSSFMTEHAIIIYEDMKKFYINLQPIVGLQINKTDHVVPPNDMHVNKLMDILNKPGCSEREKYFLIEKDFLNKYHTDIIITAKYRNKRDTLHLIIYFIVKSKKRIVVSDMSFHKNTFFCEKMIPFRRASKTVLCKDKEDISLYIFLKNFLGQLCPGIVEQLTGKSDDKQDTTSEQPSQKQRTIYLTQLSFMDPYLGYSLNNTQKGNLIDHAVSEGIEKVTQSNKALAFNARGHRIENTNQNCNKLINIMFDPNLEQNEKLLIITSNLLVPHKADCIVTGQYIPQRKPTDLRILLIRNNSTIENQNVPISKNLFCPDKTNSSQKILCPGMRDNIVRTVHDLLTTAIP
jgi:hypothetical protein